MMRSISSFSEFIKPLLNNGWESVTELAGGKDKRFDVRIYRFKFKGPPIEYRLAIVIFDRQRQTFEWKDLESTLD